MKSIMSPGQEDPTPTKSRESWRLSTVPFPGNKPRLSAYPAVSPPTRSRASNVSSWLQTRQDSYSQDPSSMVASAL